MKVLKWKRPMKRNYPKRLRVVRKSLWFHITHTTQNYFPKPGYWIQIKLIIKKTERLIQCTWFQNFPISHYIQYTYIYRHRITFLYQPHHLVPQPIEIFFLQSSTLEFLGADESHFPLPSYHVYYVSVKVSFRGEKRNHEMKNHAIISNVV